MSKDPAFLFYSSDFLVGTMDMDFETKGKYITLLCVMHQKGPIRPEKIGLLIGEFDEELRSKFIQNKDGSFYNERLEEERKKRAKHSEKQRQNVLKRWNKKPKETDKCLPPYDSGIYQTDTKTIPLENENENENEIINKIVNKNVNKTYREILNFFPEQLQPKNPKQIKSWFRTIELLNEKDKIPFETIIDIVKKTREDDFWSKTFLSLTKLRKKNPEGVPYILVFSERFKDSKKTKQLERIKKNSEGWEI